LAHDLMMATAGKVATPAEGFLAAPHAVPRALEDLVERARAAGERELLAALREPSPAREQARLAAWRDTRPHPRTSDWLASVVEADLRAFARENGLEVPDGG
jgi:hypothetical protein